MPRMFVMPLCSIVLPGGRLKVRMNSDKFRALLGSASASQSEFGVYLSSDLGRNTLVSDAPSFCTRARMIDFDYQPYGFEVIIEGVAIAEVCSFWHQDGVEVCVYRDSRQWCSETCPPELDSLSSRLEQVAEAYPQILSLHEEWRFDDWLWVCCRWLELLPLSPMQFERFIRNASAVEAARYIASQIVSPQTQSASLH